jgi:signal transduction histidine kinase
VKTGSRQKVLIVDDVAKNIQLVANFLKQSGYEINYALSGKAAIRHVKKDHFDLILLDIMMPEMDGFEVCEKLKEDERTKDLPVIFLTAKTDIESVTKAFEIGGIDYITKPFNKAELLARVKTHLELQLQKKNLSELNATKDKFFSIIAHDLRSPLNQLIGLSEILQNMIKSDQTEDAIRMVNIINESAKSGRMLLENLLEWSRSQTGSMNFSPETLDLSTISDEIIDLVAQNARQKEITIASNIKNGITAFADANMIKTILRNLISNSIKFTFKGGAIQLDAKVSKDKVTYSVTDNGIGIDENDIKKLFRLDVNPKTIGQSKEKGTGLGLILCKEFVEINGGEIWAKSEFGKGSSFLFRLPIGEDKGQ